MTINAFTLAAGLLLASSAALAHDMGAMGTTSHGAAPTYGFGEPGKAGKVDRVIAVKMLEMSFAPASVAVKRGETVRFVVTNAGPVDHDFTLGDAKAEAEHRAEMLEMAAKGMTHGDEANAIMLKPGQTKTLTWKFTKPGKLEFDCNIPGHWESGMRGTIDVASGR